VQINRLKEANRFAGNEWGGFATFLLWMVGDNSDAKRGVYPKEDQRVALGREGVGVNGGHSPPLVERCLKRIGCGKKNLHLHSNQKKQRLEIETIREGRLEIKQFFQLPKKVGNR